MSSEPQKTMLVRQIQSFANTHGWHETAHLLQLVVMPCVGRHIIDNRDWFEKLYEVLFDKPDSI